jgi:hypothetical protein
LLRKRLKEFGAIGGKATANKLSKDQRARESQEGRRGPVGSGQAAG